MTAQGKVKEKARKMDKEKDKETAGEKDTTEEYTGEITGERGGKKAEKQTGKVSLRQQIQKTIMEEIERRRTITDEELWALIDQEIMELGRREFVPLKEKMDLRRRLFDSFCRLGILQELVDDPQVTEIMVNGREKIFIERSGREILWDKCFDSEEQLEDLIQQIVSRVNRIVNVSSPVVDARLEDGSRVHVVLPPIALDGPAVTIRKFPEPITIKKLIQYHSITREAAEFLRILVVSGYNIFISGGTNSGKSTFLNALSAFIPEDERVITIEDSAELQIQQVPNLVRLETRNANSEGEGAVTIRDLIRAALRMNPSRIIVGEVRSGEAFDLLTALNTGHSGMGTGHANSPQDMLSRLESMVLMAAELPLMAIRSQICAAIDIIVQLGRLRDKSRRVLSIVELLGMKEGEIQMNPLYVFREDTENTTEPAKKTDSQRKTEAKSPRAAAGRRKTEKETAMKGGAREDEGAESCRQRRKEDKTGEAVQQKGRENNAGEENRQRRKETVEGRLVLAGQLTRKEKLWAAGYEL